MPLIFFQMSTSNPGTYFQFVNIISLLFSMWGVIALTKAVAHAMPESRIRAKFFSVQLTIVFSEAQGTILTLLASRGVIDCVATRGPMVQAYRKYVSWLIAYCWTSRSRSIHLYGYVTITAMGWLLGANQVFWREVSLSCLTCCERTGPASLFKGTAHLIFSHNKQWVLKRYSKISNFKKMERIYRKLIRFTYANILLQRTQLEDPRSLSSRRYIRCLLPVF